MANKKARVLAGFHLDGISYKPNQVIEADSALIKELEKEGSLDSNASAVKHCIENEGAEPILHQRPEDAAVAAAAAKRADALKLIGDDIAHLEATLETIPKEEPAGLLDKMKASLGISVKGTVRESIQAAIEAKRQERDAL